LENGWRFFSTKERGKPQMKMLITKIRSYSANSSAIDCLNALGKTKKTKEMLNYYLKCIDKGHIPHLEELGVLYRTFARFSTRTEWTNLVSKIHYKQQPLLTTDLLYGHIRFGLHNEYEKVEAEMKNLGWKLDPRGHVSILSSYLISRQYNGCVKYGKKIKNPSIEIISKMLMALIKMKKFRDYDELRLQMRNSNIVFTVNTFNVLMAEFSRIQKYDRVVQEWKEFKIDRMDDGLLLFPIVEAHARSFDFVEIMNLIELMKVKKIKDESIISVIMKSYTEKEMYKDIEVLLKEMKDMNIQPDIKFYTELVNVYFKQLKFDKIDEILKLKNLYPDIIFFNNLLSKYSQIYNAKKYKIVLNMIEKSNLVPDAFTITTMLNAIGSGLGDSNDIAIIEEKHQSLFNQTKLCQSALMRAYSYKSQFEKAKFIWKKYNLKTPMALSIAVDTAGRAKDHQWMQEIVQGIDSKSFNQNNLISLIEAYCRLEMFGEALNYTRYLVDNFDRFENRKKAFLTVGQGFIKCKDVEIINQVVNILTGPLGRSSSS
jgi:pentatricopeptide repeat protein